MSKGLNLFRGMAPSTFDNLKKLGVLELYTKAKTWEEYVALIKSEDKQERNKDTNET